MAPNAVGLIGDIPQRQRLRVEQTFLRGKTAVQRVADLTARGRCHGQGLGLLVEAGGQAEGRGGQGRGGKAHRGVVGLARGAVGLDPVLSHSGHGDVLLRLGDRAPIQQDPVGRGEPEGFSLLQREIQMDGLAGFFAGGSGAVGPEDGAFSRPQLQGGETEAVSLLAVVGEEIALQIYRLAAGVDQLDVIPVFPGVGIREHGEVPAADLVQPEGRGGRIPGQEGAAQHQGEAADQDAEAGPPVQAAAGEGGKVLPRAHCPEHAQEEAQHTEEGQQETAAGQLGEPVGEEAVGDGRCVRGPGPKAEPSREEAETQGQKQQPPEPGRSPLSGDMGEDGPDPAAQQRRHT